MVGLALQHEGVLDLDEPISTYVGDQEWFGRLPNKEGMTLRHLLTHSAGLVDHIMVPEFQGGKGNRSVLREPGGWSRTDAGRSHT